LHFIVVFSVEIWLRLAWLPFTIHAIGSAIGQREYDNNACDFFYFSD
jgi:hypothetical protein